MRRRAMACALLIFSSLLAGCPGRRGDDGDMGGDPNLPDLSEPQLPGELTITPNPIQLVVTGQEQSLPLSVMSSNYGDVTLRARYALSEPGLGNVQNGVLTVRGVRGGRAKLVANFGIQRGEAEVIIKVNAPDYIDPTAPANPKGYFGGPAGGAKPVWAYPLSNTMLPKNHPQMDMQWTATADGEAYRLRIESPTYVQDAYFGRAACSADIECHFKIKDSLWQDMSRTMGGVDAKLTLSASPSPGGNVGTADPLLLSFSPEDVKGGLYYWSTTITGLYRVPLGAKTAQIFVQKGNQYNCAGCHAVSRDGKKVAMEFGGADQEDAMLGGGGIVDGAMGTRYLLKPPLGGFWNLQTFSPKGDMLLVNWKQTGRVINADSGQKLYDFPGRMAQPEWSPDGLNIVYVSYPATASGPEWTASKAGDIMVMPFNNGAWGEAQVIVPAKAGAEYHFYPSWTPDSKWIIFNTGKVPCEGFGGGECNTYDAKNTTLRIVQARAGATPINLTRATYKTGKSTNWPRVTPFTQNGGKLIFFTFSAKFPYGFVKPDEEPQIWMSAVDLGKAAANPDQDPSFAPFWLTFQNPRENNHLGTWTTDLACEKDEQCPEDFECVGGQCVSRTPG